MSRSSVSILAWFPRNIRFLTRQPGKVAWSITMIVEIYSTIARMPRYDRALFSRNIEGIVALVAPAQMLAVDAKITDTAIRRVVKS